MSEDLYCKRCGEVDNLETAPCFDSSPHYAKMSCGSCGAFIKFLAKPKNTGKRPPNKHTPESLGMAYCQLCRRPADMLGLYEVLEVHHVVEVQHGGDDDPANIWVLCADCHKTLHHRRKYLIILHLHGRMPDILRILRFPVDSTHQTSLLLLCCWLFGNRVYDLWFMVYGFPPSEQALREGPRQRRRMDPTSGIKPMLDNATFATVCRKLSIKPLDTILPAPSDRNEGSHPPSRPSR